MRREFTSKVKIAAFERAMGQCESCTRKLYPGDIRYDHRIADGLGGEPTLDNCQVLCKGCHDGKTHRQDVPAIAKSKRVRAKHLGGKKRSKFRGWRKMNGTAVYAQ